MWEYRRFNWRDERRKRWGLPYCPDEPYTGVKWQRFPRGWFVQAPWSESNMHARVAEGKILRYAVWHDGGSAAICTSKGYNRGAYWEVIGSDAQMCRLGIEAPRHGLTEARCRAVYGLWRDATHFSQKWLP